jgi:hypothetical protein
VPLFVHEIPVALDDTVHVEEAVRSTVCPFEVPWAINVCVSPVAGTVHVKGVLPLEQPVVAPKTPSQTSKLLMLLRMTVACVEPVMAPEAAVMVDVPWPMPVTIPPVVMVATVVSELDQHTVFPLQLVPPVNVDVLPS